jgi:hypothetical protein
VSSTLAAAWTCCWIDTTRLFVRHPRVNGAAGAAAVEMAPLPCGLNGSMHHRGRVKIVMSSIAGLPLRRRRRRPGWGREGPRQRRREKDPATFLGSDLGSGRAALGVDRAEDREQTGPRRIGQFVNRNRIEVDLREKRECPTLSAAGQP